ncbi:MAG TPA: VWA domain-containing protein [Thermoanaerobaculia bacterium]|nr:VWA domain-containing protein [Thermoanaerobaculia bacterium]
MLQRFLMLLAACAVTLNAQTTTPADTSNRANLAIAVEPLGDNDEGVVARVTFRFAVPSDVPPGLPMVIQGSILRGGQVAKNFRLNVPAGEHAVVRTIQVLGTGENEIEARLMIPLEESTPVLLGKVTTKVTVAKTNRAYVAKPDEGAEGVIAEGVVPETVGAVKIRAPRRDVAPNLFIVDVDVLPPVTRVEFWVEGKKILVRNATPYRAELDLGKLPKRVEVRAVGYDAKGHYVDADAFIVNERETPLEVKITRTESPDGISHFKLSVQNPKNTEIRSAVLFAAQKKIHEWSSPPYAVDIPTSRLAGIEYVRASVTDSTNYEASDLLYLSGSRYTEEIEVNLIELPVTVTDASGAPVTDLKQENFTVFENGKQQKISSFNFASNLPIAVGMLLDHSGSMKPRMNAAKEAAVDFFKDILRPTDRAFFGAFAFDATKVAPFVSDIGSLTDQVMASPDASGGTSLYDAITTGLYRFRGMQGRKALVIITDGEDTTSRLSYDDMLMYVRASRVPLYFIGIGLTFADFSGESKMKALANETGGIAYFIKDVKHLKEAYAQLEKDLRSQYLISYYTESTKRDTSYRPVEVRVDRAGARVRTIRGFIP